VHSYFAHSQDKENSMTQIDVYTKPWCPYCGRALNLLDRKGVQYNSIDVSADLVRENEMRLRSRRHTVPQIFINGVHIGGSDDLMLAENSGLLDSLLSGNPDVKTERDNTVA